MRILDIHTHAFPDALAPRAMESLLAGALWAEVSAYHDGTVAGLVASMDRAGIERAVLSSVATRPEQTAKITAWSAAVASDRIVPFASVHPACPSLEAEVERVARVGLRGIKFHPQYMACPFDDPRCVRLARAAAEHNLALLVHAGHDLAYPKDDVGSPARLRRLVDAVPEVRLLAAHGGGWHMWDEVLEHVVGLPIFLDTSYCFGFISDEQLLRLIDAHGLHRVVFGTDSPWADQAAEVAALRRLPLPEDAIGRILWDNGQRFLGEAAE